MALSRCEVKHLLDRPRMFHTRTHYNLTQKVNEEHKWQQIQFWTRKWIQWHLIELKIQWLISNMKSTNKVKTRWNWQCFKHIRYHVRDQLQLLGQLIFLFKDSYAMIFPIISFATLVTSVLMLSHYIFMCLTPWICFDFYACHNKIVYQF